MALTKEPTEGQYIAIWLYDNKIWSATYKIENGIKYRYLVSFDTWVAVNNEEIISESLIFLSV